MSPAQRIATAAVMAALLGGASGLAVAASPEAPPPSQRNETWYQFRIYPESAAPARQLDVNGSGTVVVGVPDAKGERQQWSLSGIGGKLFVKNRATGTCLTAPSGAQGSVTVRACDKNDVHQKWDLHYVKPGQAQIAPSNNLDLALTGGEQLGSGVVLQPYVDVLDQQWFVRTVG
ncbi:RICIN domain-containing protein [Streptomyces sp. NPDC049906]|uniref:RICIN domain-containing protein n=1 Tax=Streptomyces sp. NPDC049906 TaxID=3155656 RepID=UPI0034399E08